MSNTSSQQNKNAYLQILPLVKNADSKDNLKFILRKTRLTITNVSGCKTRHPMNRIITALCNSPYQREIVSHLS